MENVSVKHTEHRKRCGYSQKCKQPGLWLAERLVHSIDGISAVVVVPQEARYALFHLESSILDPTLVALDALDCKHPLLRSKEPGGLRVIGKEEPERYIMIT